MRKRVVIIAVAALLAIWFLRSTVQSGNAAPAAWVEVERRDFVFTVELEGTLSAVRSHQLGPPATRGVWEYKIAHMAPEGEEVGAGTPVLSFDASQLERRLVELQAAFESAREELEKKTLSRELRQRDDELRLAEAHGKLEKARLKLDRPEGLTAANETRTLELDRELAGREITYIEERRRFLDEADATELLVLREERDRSRARVQELETAIGRMSLEAPRGGTIVYVTNRSGEKKRVGDTVWRREKVLAIPDLSEMAAEGRVEESDSGRIAEGQRVELRLDAYPEVTFTGTVRKIGKTVLPRTRNSPIRVVHVHVELDETDVTRMRPDMRFRGQVEIERAPNTLQIPLAAVHREGSRAIVYRGTWHGTQKVDVDLGRSNDAYVEVLAGLGEGDRVAVTMELEGAS